MLQEEQLKLLRFMARYPCLDYESCLHILNTSGNKGKTALSYAFRPLTKNRYLTKGKDGLVTICAKGRALMADTPPLISVGGAATRGRVAQVARMALLMEEAGIPSFGERRNDTEQYFIPSACWRRIAPGILSTTRFLGMLMLGEKRYAVYDIGDGHMDWQIRAESSLFYYRYGSFETKADGMLFLCKEEARTGVAENIIRQTMWARRQLLSTSYAERSRPVRWSHSPIRLRAQYEHVYLTTYTDLRKSISWIIREERQIAGQSVGARRLNDPAQGDYEVWPRRYFANPASDLLKFVYFFSAVKSGDGLEYTLCTQKKDREIAHMYPDVNDSERVKLLVYKDE